MQPTYDPENNPLGIRNSDLVCIKKKLFQSCGSEEVHTLVLDTQPELESISDAKLRRTRTLLFVTKSIAA
eukprot:IDg10397t1